MAPSKRLGQGDQGWVNLVQHPFFRSVDWRRLESKTLTPPFQPATDQNNFDPTFDLEQMVVDDFGGTLQQQHQHQHQRMNDRQKASDTTKNERDRTMILEKFKPFDFTIFEKYEGFKDPVKRTVGDPPDWVKPAFAGAERDLLPIPRINHTTNPHDVPSIPPDDQPLTIDTFVGKKKEAAMNGSLWRSASATNLASRAGFLVDTTTAAAGGTSSSNMAERVRKRRSLGTYQPSPAKPPTQSPLVPSSPMMDITITPRDDDDDSQMPSLSEEYAMSLQGVRKKQSTRSFRERRERDRKNIHP
jgi:serine/threonine kinase 32